MASPSSPESARSRRPRRRRWLTAIVLVAVAGSAAAILLAAGTFEVDRVDFGGLHRVSYDEANQAAGIDPGDFMGTLDVGGAQRSLEDLPWIADARIRRHWPASVSVDIDERTAAAIALTAPERWVLIDIEGRVLTSALSVLPELPRLSGIAAAPRPGRFLATDAQALLAVVDAARGQPEFEVAALWRDQRGDIRARVRQLPGNLQIEVALGDESAIGAKTAAIAAVIGGLERSERVLDVSVPHLPVLRSTG